MSDLPGKCLVDTNVPIIANYSTDPDNIPDNLVDCTSACINAIDHVMRNGRLVLDAGDEIFTEYRKNLSLRGQPGVGDGFVKWVNDRRWGFPSEDLVVIIRNGDTYDEFPVHDGLADFDISDRKFVAAANAHSEKPPILQATDSKWWGWSAALDDAGITVRFLCPEYISAMHANNQK